ncbi:MAG: hypothetical protein LBR82_03270, partial [Desulfovibrio sp.]|nr:hypothetical protein [Desulfovibrio sp.]
MNKGITLLIMLVILGAMGLVFFFHVSAERDGATARKSDMPTAVSVRKPDAAGNPPTDLIRIDPPMSSLDPPAGSRPDGSPGPVRLVAGVSPAQADARARTSAREGETSAAAPARQMPQGQQGQGQQPQGQQPQGQQGQAQQGQTRQTQPEGASGIRPAGRQTYPPSLTPWETSAASSPAARTTESQGAYVAPVFPEPAEPQRPASAPAA